MLRNQDIPIVFAIAFLVIAVMMAAAVITDDWLGFCDPDPFLYFPNIIGFVSFFIGTGLFIVSYRKEGRLNLQIPMQTVAYGFVAGGIAGILMSSFWLIPMYGHLFLWPVC